MKQQSSHQQQTDIQKINERRGSVIVVVLALLGALTLLGFLFYTLSAQHQVNAEYFSNSAKVAESSGIDPDILFDFALRQVIVGPHDTEYNSALWGGRKSLLATMYGRDLHPFNGSGINLHSNGSTPFVDLNYDGVADGAYTRDLQLVHDGPVAWGAANTSATTNIQSLYPAPDVPYTYPGINSLFLSNDSRGLNSAGSFIRIVKPSYHFPQGLRSSTATTASWYTDSATRARSLRPHSQHLAVDSTGVVSGINRFTSSFPFGDPLQEGIWTDRTPNNVTDPTDTGISEYDADPSNIGLKDSIYLDLDFPVQELPDGTKYIPIFSIKVVDADGLLNLNAVGNLYGDVTLNNASLPFGRTTGGVVDSISQSNQGVSASEINPIPALTPLTATPTLTDTVQHKHFFGRDPATNIELANMEWWWLLTGRGNMSSENTFSEVYLGRWGEISRLQAGLGTTVASRLPSQFSRPGVSYDGSNFSAADDNENASEGNAYRDGTATVWPSFVWQQPFGHPLDFYGRGHFAKDNTALPTSPNWQHEFKQFTYLRFASYHDYIVHPGIDESTFGVDLDGDGTINTSLVSWVKDQSGSLMNSPFGAYQIDEPSETLLDEGEAVSQSSDDIFGSDVDAALHISNSDSITTNFSSRAYLLAPFLFSTDSAVNPEGQETRQRFTATSWDIKTHGQTFKISPEPATAGNDPVVDKFRYWEFNAAKDLTIYPASGINPASPVYVEFPPEFPSAVSGSANDPFRSELRELLRVDGRAQTIRRPQRKLSINGVLEKSGTDLRFRPLTPHPLNLSATAIPSMAPSTNPTNLGTINQLNQIVAGSGTTLGKEQEWWARRDRQLMARDIYVMLYTFGGYNNSLDYTTSNASRGLYSDAQLEQMAQFAVNLVDSLDTDDTITQFVYDKDLSNGWTPNDDGYSSPPAASDTDRGMVRGVEEHQLSFSEAMAIFAKKIDDMGTPIDHDATEYDDADHSDFLYIELENASPHIVKFDQEAWQIVVSVTGAGGILTTEERRLTLTANAPSVSSNSSTRYAIGTTGDVHKAKVSGDTPGARTGTKLPSLFKVDPVFESGGTYTTVLQQIAPSSSLALDLITSGTNTYRVNKAPSTGTYQDGTQISSSSTTPSGTDLLVLGTDTEKDNIPLGGGAIKVKLQLRRRLNLNRSRPTYEGESASSEVDSQDNPWVQVDEMTVDLSTFILGKDDDKDTTPSITDKLQGNGGTEEGLFSKEREEVLTANNPANYPTGTLKRNSLGTFNNKNPSVFNSGTGLGGYKLWQPHFNRNFASVTELFAVPLYGPDELLTKMGSTTSTDRITESETAGSRFLHPDLSGNLNRWHRILEFIEVPSRQHRHSHDGSPSFVVNAGETAQSTAYDPGVYRTAGKLNLNMIRHYQVLAGLLDDKSVMNLFGDQNITSVGDGSRLWWRQFLEARDGTDPYTGGILPGTSKSRPFRSSNFSQRSISGLQDPLQDTVYRRLPLDSGQPIANQRGLFEVGTLTEHNNKSVDITLKHKLLGKVVNNSTNRSHVFHVFVQVDYFEVTEQTAANGNKVNQIGAKLSSSPGYRGYFVVDRSRAFEQVNSANLPSTNTFSFDQSFNYHALIKHRQIIK